MADLPAPTAPTTQTAEQKFADLLWKKFTAADADHNDKISLEEFETVRNALIRDSQYGTVSALNLMIANKDDASPQNYVTKTDCINLSNKVTYTAQDTSEFLETRFKEFLKTTSLSDEKKKEAYDAYSNKITAIDSDHNTKITIGELMINNEGSFSIAPPPKPDLYPIGR